MGSVARAATEAARRTPADTRVFGSRSASRLAAYLVDNARLAACRPTPPRRPGRAVSSTAHSERLVIWTMQRTHQYLAPVASRRQWAGAALPGRPESAPPPPRTLNGRLHAEPHARLAPRRHPARRH